LPGVALHFSGRRLITPRDNACRPTWSYLRIISVTIKNMQDVKVLVNSNVLGQGQLHYTQCIDRLNAIILSAIRPLYRLVTFYFLDFRKYLLLLLLLLL